MLENKCGFIGIIISTDSFESWHSSLSATAGPLEGILCSFKADECTLVYPFVGIHRKTPLMSSSPGIASLSWSTNFDGSWDEKYVTVQSAACSKQRVVFLHSYRITFFQSVSSKSMVCSHTVILTWLQFERIPVSSYSLIRSVKQ